MKKLKGMTADALAAETTLTSPSQDSNVWREMMLSAAAGLVYRYPGDVATQEKFAMVFMMALEDGLNDRAKRALLLAQRFQESVNKLESKGGE